MAHWGFCRGCIPHGPFTFANELIVNTCLCRHSDGRKDNVSWRLGPVACRPTTLLSGIALATAGSASARLLSLSSLSWAAPHNSLFFVPFFSKRLYNIIHLLRLSFMSFTGCSLRISRKSSKALSDNLLFYLVSSFYSSGKCHHL